MPPEDNIHSMDSPPSPHQVEGSWRQSTSGQHQQHQHQQHQSLGGPYPHPHALLAHPGHPSRVVMPSWSEAIQSATTSANNLVAHATATPALKNLVVGVEAWQSSLRSEAQQRMGGLKMPLQITSGLLADDWDLLKRVGAPGGGASHPSANASNKPFLQLSMKRSASENSLESMNNAQGTRKHSKQTNAWIPAGGSGSPTGMGVWDASTSVPQHLWPHAAYAEAHASAMQAIVAPIRPPTFGLLTAAEHEEDQDAERRQSQQGTGYFTATPPYTSRGMVRAYGSMQPLSVHHAPLGMPRVPTAPSLQELGESLNTSAHRNLEAVKAALQSAQASIQETANNCTANLQTLTNLFQANLGASGGPLQAALSNSRAMVTWSISNGSDPLGGAMVPWQVFPRVLRARDLDPNAGALVPTGAPATGGEDAAAGANARGAVFDWVTPLEQYMLQLDAKVTRGLDGASAAGGTRKLGGPSIRDPGRQVAIVTTASLPWLTGTAVNPLLRAAYLATDVSRKVTLVLPWLSPSDQARVFPANVSFETPEQQEEYVRSWAKQRTGLDCNFKVTFYPSRYAAEKGSILPVGDITQVIPEDEADVAVLEEPEHLNWYHHGRRWTDKFKHVVGVMHTNYLDYARREDNGGVKEMVLKHINAWVCRIHCHKVVKLSDAVQPLPREDTMFVHGVSPAFLRVGQAKATQAAEAGGSPVFQKGAYFLGKVLWAKGYTELLDRLNEHTARTGEAVDVDVYGSGPDLKSVEEEAGRRQLGLRFNGARDHADESLQDYRVFINPSLSDVVATTTAEALAMGKWVVCADHPSNKFFQRFPNCLIYRDSDEFSSCLSRALHNDPRPLSAAQLHELTWEAATERFLDVADVSPGGGLAAPLEAGMDKVLAALHNAVTGVEFLRVAMGAGSRTRDTPARVTDYTPDENDIGGFFDNSARARRSWEKKDNKAPKSAAVARVAQQAAPSTAVKA